MKPKTREEANYEATKLDALVLIYGLTVASFIEDYALEDVVPGICMERNCDYTSEYEPDQREGWCEECGKPTVKSGLVLAGII